MDHLGVIKLFSLVVFCLLQKGFVSDPEINNSLLFFIIFQKPCQSLIERFHQLSEEEAAKVQTFCTYVEALIVLKMLQ